MKKLSNTFFIFLFLGSTSIFAQKIMPVHPETGMVYYEGTKKVKPKCKKKIYKKTEMWASEKLAFPPMVFSTISTSKDTLRLRAVTEVPSAKRLHPISFNLTIVAKKQSYFFIAGGFYIEDINLSLDDWLKKYADSENERILKNKDLLTKGLDSHVFLALEDLKKIINNEKK